MANADKSSNGVHIPYVKIGKKNGWPLVLTVIVASVLILFLHTGVHILNVPLDASQWPGFADDRISKVPDLAPSDMSAKAEPATPSKKPLNGEALHRILAATMFLLILCNTYLYLRDSREDPLDKSNKRLKRAWTFTFWLELTTVLWIIKIILGGRISRFDDEIAALVMFTVFAFVDFVTFQIANAKHMKEPDNVKLEEEYHFALGQTLFVDLPVIVGIGVLIILVLFLDHSFSESEHYLLAFFSGATVMHLASSQIIFLILACKKDFSLAKHKLLSL